MTSATKQYRELQQSYDQLAVLLDRADQERTALSTAFASRLGLLAGVEAKLHESCQHSKDLQAKLNEATKSCDTLADEVKAVKAGLLGQVGAAQNLLCRQQLHCVAS